jgi:hypothetical protein
MLGLAKMLRDGCVEPWQWSVKVAESGMLVEGGGGATQREVKSFLALMERCRGQLRELVCNRSGKRAAMLDVWPRDLS